MSYHWRNIFLPRSIFNIITIIVLGIAVILQNMSNKTLWSGDEEAKQNKEMTTCSEAWDDIQAGQRKQKRPEIRHASQKEMAV